MKAHIDANILAKLIKTRDLIETIESGAGELYWKNIKIKTLPPIIKDIEYHSVLSSSFVWDDTEQGHGFWLEIYNKLGDYGLFIL
jgi:hypothetical protein